MRCLDHFIYGRYQAVVSVSRAVEDALLKWLKKEHSDKFSVIYNGIDLERFSQALPYSREELSLCEQDIVLCSVGRMVYGKDFATILYALTQLPDQYKAIFIGDGPMLNENRKLAQSLNLSSRVRFLGNKSNVEQYLKMSDIYIASSFFEGFGVTVLEAMASGCPVIATEIAAFSEILQEKNQLFPIQDVNALVNRIQHINSSVVQNNLKRITDFSTENMVLNYHRLYEKCLKNKN